MTPAERQAKHRAKRKAELEALRNNEAPPCNGQRNVTDDELDKLRHGIRWLKLENQRLLDDKNRDDVTPLRNKITKHESTIKELRKTIEKLKAFRAEEVDKWLPDELKKEKSKLKGARTRLRNDNADFDRNIANLRAYERQMKSLTKPKVRLILNCLHPDKQPPENHDRYAKAFAAFNGAVA